MSTFSPRCHMFTFDPLAYMPMRETDGEAAMEEAAADKGLLRDRLLSTCGQVFFPGLRAWRLRLDSHCPDPARVPWAVEVPPGAFSGFYEGSVSTWEEVTQRDAVIAAVMARRKASLVPAWPTSTRVMSLGKRALCYDMNEHNGVTFYRVALLTDIAITDTLVKEAQLFFFALREFLIAATKNPDLILQRRYTKNGNPKRPQTSRPIAQRKDENGRAFRGPTWTPEEDEILRRFFKAGFVVTESQFERQQQQLLLAGQSVPLMRTTLPIWQERILTQLNNNRTLPAIIQRVQILNAQTRKKYTVHGRIPATSREAFSQEFLGFLHDANHYRGARKRDTYWRIYLCSPSDRVAILVTKTPALSVGTYSAASPDPLTLVAFERCSDLTLPVSILSDCHGGVWYRRTTAVEGACLSATQRMHQALQEGDVTYRAAAKLLRRWLPSSLVMLALEAPAA